jgi:hypothetical protein
MMRAKSRDRAKIAGYVNSRVSAVADAVVRQVVKDYGLTPGKPAPAKPATAKAGAIPVPEGLVQVSKRPPDDFLDWDAPGARTALPTGKGRLAKPFEGRPVGTYVRWAKK